MAGDPMGLTALSGAGTIGPTLESLVRQSVLRQQMQLAFARQAEEARQFAESQRLDQERLGETRRQFDTSAGQRGKEFSQQVREYDEGAPQRLADLERTTGENNLRQRLVTTRGELRGDPRFGPAVRAVEAGIPIEGVNTEETPEQIQQRKIEAIREGGNQNVRAANAAAANRRGQVRTIQTVATAEHEQQYGIKRGTPIVVTREIQDGVPTDVSVDVARPTADITNRMAARQQAKPIMSRLWELSRQINTKPGAWASVSGKTSELAAKANLDPTVAEYIGLIELYKPLIARMVGHSGVLTELDVQSVKAGLPGPMDSQDVANRKMANITGIMDEQIGMGSYGADTPASSQPSTGLPPGVTVTRVR